MTFLLPPGIKGLKQYDEIIQDQLEHGIIENVKGDGVVSNVTHTYPTRKS